MTHFRLSPKWMPLALGFAQRLDEFADDAPAETEIVSGDGRDALTFQVADHVRTSSQTPDLPMARISVSLFQPSVNGMQRAASSETNRRHFDSRSSSRKRRTLDRFVSAASGMCGRVHDRRVASKLSAAETGETVFSEMWKKKKHRLDRKNLQRKPGQIVHL